MENSLAIPQLVKHGIMLWPSNSTFRCIHKRTESRHWDRYLYVKCSQRYSQTIQLKGGNNLLPIKGWMDKHTMEYYSAIKRDEVLTDPTTRRNLENTLSKRSQTQKVTCCMTPFTCNPQHGQIHGDSWLPGLSGLLPRDRVSLGSRAVWWWVHNTVNVLSVLNCMLLNG